MARFCEARIENLEMIEQALPFNSTEGLKVNWARHVDIGVFGMRLGPPKVVGGVVLTSCIKRL